MVYSILGEGILGEQIRSRSQLLNPQQDFLFL